MLREGKRSSKRNCFRTGVKVNLLCRELELAGHHRTMSAHDHIEQDLIVVDTDHPICLVIEKFVTMATNKFHVFQIEQALCPKKTPAQYRRDSSPVLKTGFSPGASFTFKTPLRRAFWPTASDDAPRSSCPLTCLAHWASRCRTGQIGVDPLPINVGKKRFYVLVTLGGLVVQ